MRLLRKALRSESGISAVEFALVLPMFVGMMGAGFEIAWLMLSYMKVQQVATMTADLAARDGASTGGMTEAQVYDLLSAMDVAGKPLNLRTRGRMIVTAIVGEDTNADGTADLNRIKWQRFDGNLVEATPRKGCWSTSTVAQGVNRQLRIAEPLFHVQVTYRYSALIVGPLVSHLGTPRTITRTASYRGRGAAFQPLLAVDGYPAKNNCTLPGGI